MNYHAGFVVSIAANYSSPKEEFYIFFYQVYILPKKVGVPHTSFANR